MIISRHRSLELLMQNKSDKTEKLIKFLLSHANESINKEIYSYFKKNKIQLPTAEHYLLLNKKAHKVIKEVLESEGKDVATYIKIATSLITQATITLEHQFREDVNGANEFISNTMLADLSNALYLYFNYNDYSLLVSTIDKVRIDVKFLLD
jgi:hypothetical protein